LSCFEQTDEVASNTILPARAKSPASGRPELIRSEPSPLFEIETESPPLQLFNGAEEMFAFKLSSKDLATGFHRAVLTAHFPRGVVWTKTALI